MTDDDSLMMHHVTFERLQNRSVHIGAGGKVWTTLAYGFDSRELSKVTSLVAANLLGLLSLHILVPG
eukprot:3493691-Amphidinium_carterae.1